jgi:hypothetical protein
MNAAKPAGLPPDIMASKPVTTPTEIKSSPKPVESAEPVEPAEVKPKTGKSSQCSVQVDPDRYYRLGKAKLDLGKSGQTILIEAIDLWLKKNKF